MDNHWEPEDDLVTLWSDETGDERTKDQISKMTNEMKEVANKYGFDLSGYGTTVQLNEYFNGLRRQLKKAGLNK